jgi:hypothetical protein
MEVVPRPLAHHRLHDSVFSRSASGLIESRLAGVSALTRPALPREKLLQAPFPIRLWHLASFDAPTVAVIWSLAFAWVANVRLPLWTLVLIALGVWTVYVADRLLDARTGMRSLAHDQLRERHIFHWRHRRILVPAAVASALVAAWFVLQLMPSTTRKHDAFLAAASLVYFTRVHSGRNFLPVFSKELLVGAIFTFGCALPTFSRVHLALGWWPLLTTIFAYAFLAWLNCYAIDQWESRNASSSRKRITFSALALGAACLIGSAFMSAQQSRPAELLACGAAAALLIAVLDRARNHITPVTLRVAADLALLTPAVLLALAPLQGK